MSTKVICSQRLAIYETVDTSPINNRILLYFNFWDRTELTLGP